MTKSMTVPLTTVLAILFVGLTVDYFPQTRFGFALQTILFVLAAYPVYRTSELGPDRTYVLGAIAFVPAAMVMHELKQYLPVPFIRYSAAVIVAGSFAIGLNKIFRRHER